MGFPNKKEVEDLLNHFNREVEEGKFKQKSARDAYNYLVDFVDNLTYETHEGERLVGLCCQVLKDYLSFNNKG